MDAVTYPTEEVVQFIADNVVPLRFAAHESSISEDYNAIWTPTLLVLDFDGNEIQRSVGFFAPGEFIAMLLLGIAKVRFSHGEFDGAQVCFQRLLEHYPESDSVPEAIFFQGVTLFKMKHDPKELKRAYERLVAEYPNSAWTKRAVPYRLI